MRNLMNILEAIYVCIGLIFFSKEVMDISEKKGINLENYGVLLS